MMEDYSNFEPLHVFLAGMGLSVADEEELLEGETKRSGENKDLGGCSEVLEYEVFAPVSRMLEELGFLKGFQIGGYKENMPILGLQQR
jgi:hypothetical protein